jgi:hypothetical protein
MYQQLIIKINFEGQHPVEEYPKEPQRNPKESHLERGFDGTPKESQRNPKGTPKEPQRNPKGTPKEPQRNLNLH